MRAVARLNRWVTNPIQRLWAPPSTAASATGWSARASCRLAPRTCLPQHGCARIREQRPVLHLGLRW